MSTVSGGSDSDNLFLLKSLLRDKIETSTTSTVRFNRD